MSEEKKKTVSEILLGKEEDLGIIEAYQILVGPHRIEDDVANITRQILNGQFSGSCYDNLEAFPKIIEALFAAFATEADEVIVAMVNYYAQGTVPSYPLGIVLGVFRGIGIVTFPSCKKRCAEKLTDLLLKLVFGNTAFDPSQKHRHLGMLSEAASAYFRPTEKKEMEARVYEGFKFIVEVNKTLSIRPPLSDNQSFLSLFGRALVDEFNYKLFADLSTSQRAEALTLYDSTGRRNL